jgi:hypothetical protein
VIQANNRAEHPAFSPKNKANYNTHKTGVELEKSLTGVKLDKSYKYSCDVNRVRPKQIEKFGLQNGSSDISEIS